MSQYLAPPWTDEQWPVVAAEPGARVLVDAGPGTGKTAVACGRVAHLIDAEGLEADSIWMVSFTRTAVHEIRNRIAAHLKDPDDARSIRIATLDAHSWSIRAGFDESASQKGGYEANILTVTNMVSSHEGVFEYLSGVQHLLVDEAQDMVGARAELVMALIRALPHDAGVTVLADEAQGIYGFADGDGDGRAGSHSLPEALRLRGCGFEERELQQVHRTDDHALLALLRKGRAAVRPSGRGRSTDSLQAVREIIQERNHGQADQPSGILDVPPQGEDLFLLFRRRGEALKASGYFGEHPHRLRLSGLPVAVHPWLALMLWDWTNPTITKDAFADRWGQRVSEDAAWEAAWGSLVRVAGESESRVSVRRLASVAARPNPPADLCSPDFGSAGPVVGTIHAAKGREASEVRLYLPRPTTPDGAATDEAEEARVLFVGASRARDRLLVGAAERTWPRQLDSGRAFTPNTKGRQKQPAASVEVGREGDILASGMAGRRFFGTAQDVREAQARMVSMMSAPFGMKAEPTGPDLDWVYCLQLEDGSPLGYLSGSVNRDLFRTASYIDAIVGKGRKKPPFRINHLHGLGLRTLAVAEDSPDRALLHEPWSESGFLLAPLLIGYPTVWFRG